MDPKRFRVYRVEALGFRVKGLGPIRHQVNLLLDFRDKGLGLGVWDRLVSHPAGML